ncbi:MAG TPA: aminotransferase class IV [Fulvivirga sp.]|nr:aminotransferase class IV [Fulvivirga sp.]
MYCFVNGLKLEVTKATLNINDLAILRGYGIFDFFRTVDNKPLFLEDHLDRFYNSSKIAHLPISFSKSEVIEQVNSLLTANKLPISGIRMVLTGGYSEDGYSVGKPNLIITQGPITFPAEELYTNGVKLITHNFLRELPEVKTVNYMTGIWLKSKIKEEKAFDALYVNNGQVLELTRSNIFIITKEGKIITPQKNILKGVTRKKVLEMAASHYDIEEREISIDELLQAKEAFLTGTTKKVLPITAVDNQKIGDGKPGPISRQLLEMFNQFEKEYMDK